MRTTLLSAFLLTLAACSGGESATDETATPGSGSAATPAASDTAGQGQATEASSTVDPDEVQRALQDADSAGGGQLLPPDPTIQDPPYVPKREPEFGFESGGPVMDADLSNYWIEMTIAIDGDEVGTLAFELWPQFAPMTVRNFLRYADEGFYDGLTFHRLVRDFMIQGGDPKGDGSGDGPHGNIVAEFSNDPERKHGYGVLSMARGNSPNSASSQFFICCAEAPNVWNLDGGYASFGKLTQGVDVLEEACNVPVGGPRGTTPMRRIVMKEVRVKEGEPPRSEEPIERPTPPLPEGEPAEVTVQHVLISFAGSQVPGVTRTKEEAEALAQDIFEQAKNGADFGELVFEHTDDNVPEGDPLPGAYRLWNTGYQNVPEARKWFKIDQEQRQILQELQQQVRAKALTIPEAQAKLAEFELAVRKEHGVRPSPRAQMIPGFSNAAFSLGVGEITLLPYDAQNSKFGWHVIKRVN